MLDVVFDLALAHGRGVAVRLHAADDEVLALARDAVAPEERAYAESLTYLRRRTWVGGRAALRRALEAAGLEAQDHILANDRGAPRLPDGIAGSISHKETLAVALVAAQPHARVGVDLEIERSQRVDIAPSVLTVEELAEVESLGGEERAREVLLRFSAKEAVYKALDPYVRRYVGFREVSVKPTEDGTAHVRTALHLGEGPFDVEVTWRRTEGIILTTARVRLAT